MTNLSFTAYCKPQPQGSAKAFVVNGKARITSDNKNLKPYRHIVAQMAAEAVSEMGLELPYAKKHEPVLIEVSWYLARPTSVPKKRLRPSVKPDIDKLLRATLDALTGIAYEDDGQVTCISANKYYGAPERVEIAVCGLKY
jgi:Holliday junction resolvase RusA-like endonuclease